MDFQKPFTFDRTIRLGITAAVLYGLYRLLYVLSDVLIPFAVALLLAYLLNPLVGVIQKRVKARSAAIAITLTIVCLVLGLAVRIALPLMAAEVIEMGAGLKKLASGEWAAWASNMLPPERVEELRELAASEDVQAWFSMDNLAPLAGNAMRKSLPGVWGVVSGVAGFFFSIVGITVVLLYLIFLLMDFDQVSHRWSEILPPRIREHVTGFTAEFNIAMRRYFRGQAMVAGTVGILLASGFTIVGMPMGILLGLFIGLLNMVPYLQIVGLIPAGLLALLHSMVQGEPWWHMLLKGLIVFVIVQTIQDMILTPKILGKATGLRPWLIILSLSIWGKLLGLLGMLIALPMTCLIWAYYQRFIEKQPTRPPTTPSQETV